MAAVAVRFCRFTNKTSLNKRLSRNLINSCNVSRCSNYATICNNERVTLGYPSQWGLTREWRRSFSAGHRLWNQQASAEDVKDADYHSIIKDTEKEQGPAEKREFLAETRMLLDIVAKSLYSEKEVFIRELISNASDALEKLRYLKVTSTGSPDKVKLAAEVLTDPKENEIHIATNKLERTFIIQDTGVGMTKEEMIESLGTIARSGSKAFLEELQKSQSAGSSANNIIGQFGVGFYSTFMVADKVDVYSRSALEDSKGYKWTSDGSGTYEIQESEGVQVGTKIVLHLKTDCREFSDEETIKEVIKKYSNFVGSPIYLNGAKANSLQALWLMDPKSVTKEEHNEFYRFVASSYDYPRFILHFNTDVPLSIRCLLYVPEGKPGLFEMSRDAPESPTGVALYCRKVLIKNKAENVLPKWLRFVKGVVDSEDIPLNLSRELLQDSALLRKIRTVITNRMVRHLFDQMRKDKEGYERFYKDYSLFLKEGILTSHEQVEKEEIAKLLQFESSLKDEGEKVTLAEYCSRMKEGQSDIYFMAAPSRQLAEASPYYEAVKQKQVEVIFCYEPYDELVMIQLQQFNRKSLTSVEKEMRREKEDDPLTDTVEGSLTGTSSKDLVNWLKTTLKGKVSKVKVTKRLSTHPCLVSVEEMAAARHFVRTSMQNMPEDQRLQLLEPTMEINLEHSIMKKLGQLRTSNPELAELVADQLFDNAMVTAGLVDDPRKVTGRLNELLTKLLEKH